MQIATLDARQNLSDSEHPGTNDKAILFNSE